MDADNEAVILTALDRLMEGRTTLIFAHRLSSVIGADRILVLDDGRIAESGTHGELLAKGGRYSNLYAEQYGSGRIECHCQNGMILTDGTVINQEFTLQVPALAVVGGQERPTEVDSDGQPTPWEESGQRPNQEHPL